MHVMHCYILLLYFRFNSLASGRSGCNFKSVIFTLVLLIGIFKSSTDNAINWMPQDFTDDKSTLVQVMAWCCQATSHYLSQCWPRSLSPYDVTRPQWVKWLTRIMKNAPSISFASDQAATRQSAASHVCSTFTYPRQGCDPWLITGKRWRTCVSQVNWSIIGSYNCLSPVWCLAIIRINTGILLTVTRGINFS